MGGESLAIAVVVVILLLYLAPALWRRRSVLNEVHSEEKFSPQLRLLNTVSRPPQAGPVQAVCHEYGTIFIRERRVMAKEIAQRERMRDLRAVARERAQARARIARRAIYKSRALFGGMLLLGVTLVAWLLVAFTSFSWVLGVVVTALSGGYGIGLNYLNKLWGQENQKDQRLILQNDEILAKHGAWQVRARRARQIAPAGKNIREVESKRRSLPTGKKASTSQRVAVRQSVDMLDAVVQESVTTSEQKVMTEVQREAGSRNTGSMVRRSEKMDIRRTAQPSYTLKGTSKAGITRKVETARVETARVETARKVEAEPIMKRHVKPYEPAPQVEAAVPYRPQKPGERLGEVQIEGANAAPAMTGAEELRLDLLGSGNKLDDLLARRRA